MPYFAYNNNQKIHLEIIVIINILCINKKGETVKRIYFDNNATTRVDDEAIEIMNEYFNSEYGNSSSAHDMGIKALEIIDECREKIAAYINCEPSEIIFTGSGTESDNIALLGFAHLKKADECHIIVSEIEHSAILNTAKELEREGYSVSFAKVNREGIIDLDYLESIITEKTKIISIMYANNETGAIQPIKEISEITTKRNIVFHTDAVQYIGKGYIDVKKTEIEMLSASGHKFHAPKGVGFLYLKKGIQIKPLIFGGSHERKIRPGTVNVPYIVSMTKALDVAYRDKEKNTKYIADLRDKLKTGILNSIDNIVINTPENSVYNTLNISIPGIEGEAMLFSLSEKGIYISTGSACSSGDSKPSHVMSAMGRSNLEAYGSLRLSLSKYNTQDEIEYVIKSLKEIVNRIRKISPYK